VPAPGAQQHERHDQVHDRRRGRDAHAESDLVEFAWLEQPAERRERDREAPAR